MNSGCLCGQLYFIVYVQSCILLILFNSISSREFNLNFDSSTNFDELASKFANAKPQYEDSELVKARESYTYFQADPCITSMSRLRSAYKAEGFILREIAKIVRRVKDLDKFSLDLLKEFRQERKKELKLKTFLWHPLNALHFLRRQAFRIPLLLDALIAGHATKNEIWEIQRHREASECLITAKDVNGTLLGLIRLARTYRLDKEAILEGKFRSPMLSPSVGDAIYPMRLVDVAMIIVIGQNAGLHGDAVAWAEAILPNNEDKTTEFAFMLEATFRSVGISFEAVKDYNSALAVWQSLLPPDRYKHKTSLNILEIEESIDRLEALLKIEGQPSEREIDTSNSHTEALCRHDKNVIQKNFKFQWASCLFTKPFGGWLAYKSEIINVNPFIMIFHNVLTKSEAAWLRKVVSGRLAPSKVINNALDGDEISDELRRSESQGVWDHDGEEAVRLAKRIHGITGLRTDCRDTVSNAEAFQVVNYGIAGHYQPHQDQLHSSMLDPKSGILSSAFHGSGNRLATWLYYISDVEAGGSTVFTKLNISVPVTEGAALFWYSLHVDGTGDERLFHSGCPVLIGDKWISNKFIYQIGGSRCTSRSMEDAEIVRLTSK